MSALVRSAAWRALERHAEAMPAVRLRDLFAGDPDPLARFSLCLDDLLLDCAKNRVTDETMRLLFDLPHHCDVESWRARMFAGDKINTTEHRAVLHVALRNRSNHHTGEVVTDVVNIGIGGSGLRPHMVCEALEPYQRGGAQAAHGASPAPLRVASIRPQLGRFWPSMSIKSSRKAWFGASTRSISGEWSWANNSRRQFCRNWPAPRRCTTTTRPPTG